MNKAHLRYALLAGLGTLSLLAAGCHDDDASTPPPASTNAPSASTNAETSAIPAMTSTNDPVNPPNAPKAGNPTPTPTTSGTPPSS